MNCELCNNAGEVITTVKHRHTDRLKTVSAPCICRISSLVSHENKMLGSIRDYLTDDKVNPDLSFNPGSTTNPNLLIFGDLVSFLYQVKHILMAYRFTNPKPRILLARSIDILHDYHVPNEDKVAQHLSATSVFDLIIMLFGTKEKNEALAGCMSQIVSTRLDEGKTTWIFIPGSSPNLSTCPQENSNDLLTYLDGFKQVLISDAGKARASQTASKNNAASFDVGSDGAKRTGTILTDSAVEQIFSRKKKK